MRNFKKRHYFIGGFLLTVFLMLFFLSTIIKNYVVNNSEELIGRKLTLNELHINYFKVQVTVRDFALFETNKVDTFASFRELLINYDPWKLLGNEYAVSQIRLIEPYIYISQNGASFNFDDMVASSDTVAVEQTDSVSVENSEVKFSIRNIDLQDGEFRYYDKQIDNLLSFDNLNLALPLIAWDSRSSEMGVEFSIGKRGLVKIDADINQEDKLYNIRFGTENVQLKSFTNYLKDYMNIEEFNGLLQSDIKIRGSIKHPDDILVRGEVAVDSFSLVNTGMDTLLSVNKIYTKVDSLNLKDSRYIISKLSIEDPIIVAALNTTQSNWEEFFSPVLSDTTNAETVDTTAVEDEAVPLFYRIDSIMINNGVVRFADNTLNRDFRYDIQKINVSLANVYETNNAIPVKWGMKFNNEGSFDGETHFSMANPLNLYYKGAVKNLDLHSFSPYTEYHLAYPIVSGIFNYEADIHMTPEKLENHNHLLVNEMQFGKRTKDSTASKLPVKLALYLIKDAQDKVEFELPVTGNPSEPGFKLGPVIWKTFGKFIVKTATQPFGSLAKLVGTTPDELKMIPFKYTQDSLMAAQRKTLDKIAQILTKKEDLIFSFRQEMGVDEELGMLAVKKVKNQFIQEQTFSKIKDWNQVKDSDEAFVAFLNKLSPETVGQIVSDRCLTLMPADELRSEFNGLYKKRNELLKEYMLTQKACNPSSVKLLNVDFNNMPKELEKPGFRVEVSVQ